MDQQTRGKWLIHGTKHHTDKQLLSLELSCSEYKFDVNECHVQSNNLKEGPVVRGPDRPLVHHRHNYT